MTSSNTWASSDDHADLYVRLLSFYARQAHLIDGGDRQGWVETFTPDATFTSAQYGTVARGSEELGTIVDRYLASAAKRAETHRHVGSAIDLVARTDGDCLVRSYVQIVASAYDSGSSRIVRTVSCLDTLRSDGRLLVVSRLITTGVNQDIQ